MDFEMTGYAGREVIHMVPMPWYQGLIGFIGLINVLIFLVIIIGLIFSFIAIWRMMKAHEALASAVKEINEQLKENTALQEQVIEVPHKDL